jgi:hypothetical protein
MPKFTTIPGMVTRNLVDLEELADLLREVAQEPTTSPSRLALIRDLLDEVDAEIAADERGLAARSARLSGQQPGRNNGHYSDGRQP